MAISFQKLAILYHPSIGLPMDTITKTPEWEAFRSSENRQGFLRNQCEFLRRLATHGSGQQYAYSLQPKERLPQPVVRVRVFSTGP